MSDFEEGVVPFKRLFCSVRAGCGSFQTMVLFFDSVHLLYAWLQVLYQGKNALLKLQVPTC